MAGMISHSFLLTGEKAAFFPFFVRSFFREGPIVSFLFSRLDR